MHELFVIAENAMQIAMFAIFDDQNGGIRVADAAQHVQHVDMEAEALHKLDLFEKLSSESIKSTYMVT